MYIYNVCIDVMGKSIELHGGIFQKRSQQPQAAARQKEAPLVVVDFSSEAQGHVTTGCHRRLNALCGKKCGVKYLVFYDILWHSIVFYDILWLRMVL